MGNYPKLFYKQFFFIGHMYFAIKMAVSSKNRIFLLWNYPKLFYKQFFFNSLSTETSKNGLKSATSILRRPLPFSNPIIGEIHDFLCFTIRNRPKNLIF